MNAERPADMKEEQLKCPKCRSKNVLAIGKKGGQTFCCLDCDYAVGVGVE